MHEKLRKGDGEYQTSVLHESLIIDGSGTEFKYQNGPIFFPSSIQVPLHGKFITRKWVTCLDAKYTIVVQCQNNVNVLNEYEML